MLLNEAAHPRDPDARRRATTLIVAIIVLWPLLVVAQFNPAILFDAKNLAAMGAFLRGFVPPEMSAEFLGHVVRATLETLAIATTGITLAFVVAVPLALAVTRSLSVSRIGGYVSCLRKRALIASASCTSNRNTMSMVAASPPWSSFIA